MKFILAFLLFSIIVSATNVHPRQDDGDEGDGDKDSDGNGGGGGGGKGGGKGDGGDDGGDDLQTSLTLDPSLIGPNLAQEGLEGPDAGSVASLTSKNNFINYCALPGDDGEQQKITNNEQKEKGSCNPVPMGQIIAKGNMPRCKFVSPANLDNLPPKVDIDVVLKITNIITGQFTNAQQNYFGAPQQVDPKTKLVFGHSHVVIESIDSINQKEETDPTKFSFFKGLNEAAVNGQLTVTVPGGLPPGTYRLASINTAANHQPLLVAVAQHGALDDMVYFTVGDEAAAAALAIVQANSGGGKNKGGGNNGGGGDDDGGGDDGKGGKGGGDDGGDGDGGKGGGGNNGGDDGGDDDGGGKGGGKGGDGDGGGKGGGKGGKGGGGNGDDDDGGDKGGNNKRRRRSHGRRYLVDY